MLCLCKYVLNQVVNYFNNAFIKISRDKYLKLMAVGRFCAMEASVFTRTSKSVLQSMNFNFEIIFQHDTI